LDEHGYAADISACRKLDPGLMTFEQFAQDHAAAWR
jgi:hypothetical protein